MRISKIGVNRLITNQNRVRILGKNTKEDINTSFKGIEQAGVNKTTVKELEEKYRQMLSIGMDLKGEGWTKKREAREEYIAAENIIKETEDKIEKSKQKKSDTSLSEPKLEGKYKIEECKDGEIKRTTTYTKRDNTLKITINRQDGLRDEITRIEYGDNPKMTMTVISKGINESNTKKERQYNYYCGNVEYIYEGITGLDAKKTFEYENGQIARIKLRKNTKDNVRREYSIDKINNTFSKMSETRNNKKIIFYMTDGKLSGIKEGPEKTIEFSPEREYRVEQGKIIQIKK